MNTDYLLILCTCPNKESATLVANKLVENRLAACVNILPGLTSVYFWKNQVESDEEHLLLIKSTAALYQEVERTIVEHHPYELPESIAVPIVDGLSDYLAWIDTNTMPKRQ
jgi:periplasmic divalent cation tolerance protein